MSKSKQKIYCSYIIIKTIIFLLFAFPIMTFGDDFSVNIITTPDTTSLPFENEFSAEITGGTPPYSFTWNFGDGSTASIKSDNQITETINHFYRERGKFVVQVMVIDSKNKITNGLKTIYVSGDPLDPYRATFDVYSKIGEINAIIQDNRNENILWIGADGGLIEFDMISGKKNFHIKELPCLQITSLFQTDDGILWIGTYGGGLGRFDSEINDWKVFNRANRKLNSNNISSITISNDDYLLIGTDFGIFKFDPITSWDKRIYYSGGGYLHIISIIQTSDGNIWMGTSSSGILRYNEIKDEWKIYNMENSELIANNINSIILGNDGCLWISVEHKGIMKFNPNIDQWYHYMHPYKSYFHIQTLIQSSDNNIWVSEWGYGIAQLNTETDEWQLYNYSKNNLPDQHVSSIFHTLDNNLWIGTFSGDLTSFDYKSNNWKNYNIQYCNLLNNDINALMESHDGDIWVTTNIGGVVKIDVENNEWTVFNSETNGFPSRVHTIIQNQDGNIFAATSSGLSSYGQLAHYNNDMWEIYNGNNSILPGNIYGLCQLKNNSIFLATTGGFVTVSNKNEWSIYKQDLFNSLPDKHFNQIKYTNDENIWLGTNNGFIKVDMITDEVTVYNKQNCELVDDVIFDFIQAKDDTFWIGSQMGNLANFNYKENIWTIYNSSNCKLPFGSISALCQAKDSSIWIGSTQGLVYYNYTDDEWKIYSALNSQLPDNKVDSIIQASNGDLWVGTNNGLCKLTFPVDAPSPGRLILIAGGGISNTNLLWNSTESLCTFAYRVFIQRNFKSTDIYFLSEKKEIDYTGDGLNDFIVDCPKADETRKLKIDDVNYAITDWAVKTYRKSTPLYILIIDHGLEDDGINGPGFYLSPQNILYANKLNEMIEYYESKTGGQVILINESCHSGQFLDKLKKNGRIVITSTKNNVINFDDEGANTFSSFFLTKLLANKSISDAYNDAIKKLKSGIPFTYYQEPQLDDNGDGKSDFKDGALALKLKLGGDFNVASPFPEILSFTYSLISKNTVSFTVLTNIPMNNVWASVNPPYYEPDISDGYMNINMDKIELFDKNNNLSYSGYTKCTGEGIYVFTFYAKDKYNNIAVSEPLELYFGSEDNGNISGQLQLSLDKYKIQFENAIGTISLVDTNISVPLQPGGFFNVNGIPEGNYTAKIELPYFEPIIIRDIQVVAKQPNKIGVVPAQLIISQSSVLVDQNSDNKVCLKDAIHILKTLSNIQITEQ